MDIHSTHPTSVQNVQEVALPFETVHVLLHSLSYNCASLTLSKYTARKREYTCKCFKDSYVHVQIFQHD